MALHAKGSVRDHWFDDIYCSRDGSVLSAQVSLSLAFAFGRHAHAIVPTS